MVARTRREFLGNVGKGMCLAGVGGMFGGPVAVRLWARGAGSPLDFGPLDPLVARMQETDPDVLLPELVEMLRAGETLETLVAAGALANARHFGGTDYEGYHAFMALLPAYSIALQIQGPERALPVLKVLYRNTARMRAVGDRTRELRPLVDVPGDLPETQATLLERVHDRDLEGAERAFASIETTSTLAAYDALQALVREDPNVHRTVLSWRAYATIDLVGAAHSLTLLRQCVRFCVNEERGGRDLIRREVPDVLDRVGLGPDSALGNRRLGDETLEELAATIAFESRVDAAEAVALALRDGTAPADVCAAVSIAGNRLLLHDPGRSKAEKDKPIGSVHGASVGIHASDAAHAWRKIAETLPIDRTAETLVTAAYHTAGQSAWVEKDRFPYRERSPEVKAKAPEDLLTALDVAVQSGDQGLACMAAEKYLEAGHEPRGLQGLLRRVAVTADGAMHAEKYFWTAFEEFESARVGHGRDQLVALARVSASEAGHVAPGVQEAARLLNG